MDHYASTPPNADTTLDSPRGGQTYLYAARRSGRPIGVTLLSLANFVAAILFGVVFVLAFALVVVSSAPPLAMLPVGLLFLVAAAFLIIGVKLLELRPRARVWAIRVYTFILVLDIASVPFRAPTIATLVCDAIALIGIGYLIQPSVRRLFDNSW